MHSLLKNIQPHHIHGEDREAVYEHGFAPVGGEPPTPRLHLGLDLLHKQVKVPDQFRHPRVGDWERGQLAIKVVCNALLRLRAGTPQPQPRFYRS